MEHITLFDLRCLDSQVFTWVVMPLLIFSARVMDVTLMTIRIIVLSRGKKVLAPVLGFFEVLIWLLAIRQIMQNLSNPLSYIAYAGGFATGNVVGIYLEGKLAMGTLLVRVITQKAAGELIAGLHAADYGVTSVDARGANGKVSLIYTIIRRRDLPSVLGLVRQFNPKAFISVEEVQSASAGVFPRAHQHYLNPFIHGRIQKRK